MAQRLMSLEDAANQLGISKERLKELRDAGKVRAYKDGASWKFRGEDIEKFAVEGVPQLDPPPSDLVLNLDDEGDEPEWPAPLKPGAGVPAAATSDLGLADEEPAAVPKAKAPEAAASSDLGLDDEEMAAGPASDLSLEEEVDEPTVAGMDDEIDQDVLDKDHEIDLSTDSILLSEAELGDSSGRPPSTIIGKAELDLDADLDMSPLDKGSGPASDVKLAHESGLAGAGDNDLGLDLAGPSSDFAGLEELEVDLEAESSRILAPEDVAKAQAAAKAAASSKTKPKTPDKKTSFSDLELAPTPSSPGIATSDIGIGKEGSSGTGLTGLSALELDDDDDQVLGEGSDVTLSGESSGINIISPSDSGLALDEVSLDLSGSAPMGSSLDLGMGSSMGMGSSIGMGSSVSEEDMPLEPLSISVGPESKIGEDFQLTPLGEEGADEEKDSSQVIALDEISEETGGAPISGGLSEEGMIHEDFGVGLTPGAMPAGVGVAAGPDTPFSVWNVVALAGCLLMLSLCGMMTYDLLRNIWSWDQISTPNSALLNALHPLLGR